MLSVIAGYACLIWYIVVVFVCAVGYVQICRSYSRRPSRAVSETTLPRDEVPHVTVIRPVKGLEPNLYECLAATFQQTYPANKLTVYFCVSDGNDPSLPILRKVVDDFPGFDSAVLVEDEDDVLLANEAKMGPNPKIRNMSRAYREAKGDIVWIIDCNVWVGKGVCGRLVDLLCGYGHGGSSRKYKFVHQLPLVVDVSGDASTVEQQSLLGSNGHVEEVASTSTAAYSMSTTSSHGETWKASKFSGTRLEELFLSSSHAKFYTAINTVLIAPCIVGKSNMFRRSHLDYLTSLLVASQSREKLPGIDYFSHNICEDHLIGDLLWKQPTPPPSRHTDHTQETLFGKHCLLFGDPVIQPAASMSTSEYIARRVRWLRVRKFTVTLATLVEPGTESFLCSAYGAYAVATLPWFRNALGLAEESVGLGAAVLFWIFSVGLWCLSDWTLYCLFHAMTSVEVDSDTPSFARGKRRKPFGDWVLAWLGRETLALPVWAWAVFGGVTVAWRGQSFRVGMDATVRAVGNDNQHQTGSLGGGMRADAAANNGKARVE